MYLSGIGNDSSLAESRSLTLRFNVMAVYGVS